MTLAFSPIPVAAQSSEPHLSQNGKSALPSSISNTPQDRKLRRAAAEFEGMLLSSLWKSMKSTFASPDEDSGDPAHDTLSDMSIQAMSSAVGKAGGIGLGKLILKHLEPVLAKSLNQNEQPSGKGSAPSADIFP